MWWTASIGRCRRGDGQLRTATFFVPDARLAAQGEASDFEIRALGEPATVRFVRVVRLPQAQKETP